MPSIEQTSGLHGLGPKSTDSQGSSALGKDEFVKLLMTQLANQDPTNPQDSEAFVAQLAQFANVELQQTANANLEAILLAQAANNQVSTAALVGKEVVYATDEIFIGGADGGESPVLSTKLAGNAERMVVTLTDEAGTPHTRTVEGPFRAGNVDIKVNDVFSDLEMNQGTYKIQVAAADKEGTSIDVTTRVRARITGVTFENGYAQLLIGNLRVNLNDVQEILASNAPTYTSDDEQQALEDVISGAPSNGLKDPNPKTNAVINDLLAAYTANTQSQREKTTTVHEVNE